MTSVNDRDKYIRPKDIDNRSTFWQRLVWRIEAFAWDWIYWKPFRTVSPERASDIGAWLFKKVGPMLGQHKTVINNLKLAFPEMSATEIKITAQEVWDNSGRIAGELPHMDKILSRDCDYVEIVNGERFKEILESKKGAVMVSGHFANWEVIAGIVGREIPTCVLTYRILNNPHIDYRINKLRQSYGASILTPKGLGTREMMRALSEGRAVALMNDQKFNEGLSVPFFGHDAMTAQGPTRMAYKYDVPIVTVSAYRTGPSRFKLTVHGPLEKSITGDEKLNLYETVSKISQFMEDRIREHPSQWFWQHRRWPKSAWNSKNNTE